jgi:hypothetical protein
VRSLLLDANPSSWLNFLDRCCMHESTLTDSSASHTLSHLAFVLEGSSDVLFCNIGYHDVKNDPTTLVSYIEKFSSRSRPMC